MSSFFKKNLYPLLLFFISLVLFSVNYKPGTFLVGWDNVFPEFNFALNIKRDLFAIWQQYRGLGVVDGMSHASLIVQDLARFFLSLFLTTDLIRWVYILGLHLVGGLGMFNLIKKILRSAQDDGKRVAFIAALFYMFNLGSIIQFFLPLEVFIVHFALIPWIVSSTLDYLDQGRKKNLILLGTFSILASPQAHVPTVFIAFSMMMAVILLISLFQSGFKNLKRILVIIATIFVTNAFWFLPFFVTNITNSKVVSNTKAFQMASNDIFYRNNKYGDFPNVALIKGLPLEFRHLDYKTSQTTLMMWPWLDHTRSPLFYVPAWIFFFLAILGFFYSLKSKNKHFLPFAGVFLFSFFMLGTDTPIINILSNFLRQNIPIFNVVFRFTFTKFSIIYGFSYSVLLVIGLDYVLRLLRFARNDNRLHLFICLFVYLFIFLYSLPVFKGHFFYENLGVPIPKEYFQAFDFFALQNKDERVAELPIPWYWAWLQPRWGTINSGFIWHGIEQPIMDLAFMPWGSQNENYYWELDQAIFSKNPKLLRNVLKKYDISWIYLDKNNLSTPGGKITYSDYQDILAQTPGVEMAANFGLIDIYRFDNQNGLSNFTSVKKGLKNIGPVYSYDNFDYAYIENGDYYSEGQDFEIYYLFRSLFAGKSPADQEYKISEDEKFITVNELIKIDKSDALKYSSLINEDFQVAINDSCEKNDLTTSLIKLTNGYRMVSTGSHNCIKIELPDLPLRNGYLLNIKTKNDNKRGLLINLFDNTVKKSNLETYLDNDGKEHNYYFVIPPRSFYGLGYTLYFDNISEGRETVTNDLYEVNFYEIPYEDLKRQKKYSKIQDSNKNIYYFSQSYHPGWLAFYQGKLLPHVLVNNWANGWLIPVESQKSIKSIKIVFWPQYLEFLGFALLIIAFLIILRLPSPPFPDRSGQN